MSDLEVSFGVLGGESLEQGSGADILTTLGNICTKISNQGKLKVKISGELDKDISLQISKQISEAETKANKRAGKSKKSDEIKEQEKALKEYLVVFKRVQELNNQLSRDRLTADERKKYGEERKYKGQELKDLRAKITDQRTLNQLLASEQNIRLEMASRRSHLLSSDLRADLTEYKSLFRDVGNIQNTVLGENFDSSKIKQFSEEYSNKLERMQVLYGRISKDQNLLNELLREQVSITKELETGGAQKDITAQKQAAADSLKVYKRIIELEDQLTSGELSGQKEQAAKDELATKNKVLENLRAQITSSEILAELDKQRAIADQELETRKAKGGYRPKEREFLEETIKLQKQLNAMKQEAERTDISSAQKAAAEQNIRFIQQEIDATKKKIKDKSLLLELEEKMKKVQFQTDVAQRTGQAKTSAEYQSKRAKEYIDTLKNIQKLETDASKSGIPEQVTVYKNLIQASEAYLKTLDAEITDDKIRKDLKQQIFQLDLEAKDRKTIEDYSKQEADLNKYLSLYKKFKQEELAFSRLDPEKTPGYEDRKNLLAARQRELEAQKKGITAASLQAKMDREVLQINTDILDKQLELEKSDKRREESAKAFESLYRKAADYMSKKGDVLKRNAPEDYAKLEDLINQFKYKTYTGTPRQGGLDLNELLGDITHAGHDVERFGDKVRRIFSDKYVYGVIAYAAMYARRLVMEVYQNVKEIDAAMTQLSIVTGQIGDQLDKSFDRAATSAKKLGSNITDLLGSMETFARLGYDMADSQGLAEVATMMARVADVDISEATTGLTSIIKGFGLEAKDAEYIGDVLSNIGKKYAVSAGELIEAFERSGAAFKATGTDFEKATALIAAGNAAVQDASTVGTAMKTISARIRGAKSELEELGEGYEDVAEGISKYRDELKALTNVDGTGGFDIMTSAGEYKDLYDIFIGISQVWNRMSGTSQARVTEILGGTRQLQVVSSIMQNIADATGAYDDALKSSGTLTQDYEKYLDSLAGKLGVLKSNFQALSAAILDSDWIKLGIDGLSEFVSLLEGISSKTGIGGIVGLISLLRTMGKVLASNTTYFLGFKAGLKDLGTGTKIGLIIDAFLILNSILKAISGNDILGWFNEWTTPATEKIKNLSQALAEANNELRSTTSSIKEFATSYDSISGRYIELAQKAGPLGSQGKLSTAEYEEFLDIQNKLAEMFPVIDAGVDENGNHILTLSGNVDTLKGSLDRLYEAELNVLKLEQAEKYEASQEKYNEEIKTRKDYIADLEGIIAKTKEAQEDSLSPIPTFGADEVRVVNDLISEISKTTGVEFKIADDTIDDFINYAKTKLDIAQKELQAEEANRGGILSALLPSEEFFDLAPEIQNTLTKIFGSINFSDFVKAAGGDSLEGLSNAILYSVIVPLEEANIGEAYSEFLAGEMDAVDFSHIVAQAFGAESIIDVTGPAKVALESFIRLMGGEKLTVAEFSYAMMQVSEAEKAVDEASKGNNLDAYAKKISGVKTEYQKLEEYIDRIRDQGVGSLKDKEMDELLRILPELSYEFRVYDEAINKGIPAEEAQVRLFRAMTDAAKGYITVNIAEGFKKAAEAAKQYGKGSYQAQQAMRQLGEVAPEVVSALYNEKTGMYELGDAADITAQSILDFAKVQIAAKLAEMKAHIASLGEQFLTTAKAAVISAEIIAKAAASSARLGSTSGRGHRPKGPGQEGGGPVVPEDAQVKTEYENALQEYNDLQELLKNFNNIDLTVGSGGGGGSAKDAAEQLKEAFDNVSASLQNQISLQEEAFDQAKDVLNAEDMRSALIRQVGYYQEIQRQAQKALDAVRDYYRKQGLSDVAIEQQKVVQELTKDFNEAGKQVEDAMDRMADAIAQAFSESVDEIQAVYDVLHKAADEFATSGHITVDTLQAIIGQGVEYLALLQDENGQLVINEENIKKIIAARTEQMAVESALAYVEALRTAKIAGREDELNRLLTATTDTTHATWGLVYATLGLVGLSDEEYQAALKNINALRALSQQAVDSIGESSDKMKDSLKDMKSGVDDLLKYVMDMLKDQVKRQIEALEDQKEAFSEIIELKKESLELDKEETEYSDKVAELTKKLADNQSKIDALSLVGTREAEAEKKKLLEEQAEIQKELADEQADHAYDKQVDSLDKMEEAYHKEKDEEIKKLEESISSTQKIYDMAIDYIEKHWDTLYDELIAWNTEYGNSINKDITEAWENALEAVKKYGSYTDALDKIDDDIDNIGSGGNTNLGGSISGDEHSDEDTIRAIVKTMKANSHNWFAYDEEGRKAAAAENEKLARQLGNYGVNAVRGDDGVWYIDRVGGEKLYEKYASYHTGGIVGPSNIKANEQFALLKNKEWVLSEKMVSNLTDGMKIVGRVGDIAANMFRAHGLPHNSMSPEMINNALNGLVGSNDNRKINIVFGDTNITGLAQDTIREHKKVMESFMNELARRLGVKW